MSSVFQISLQFNSNSSEDYNLDFHLLSIPGSCEPPPSWVNEALRFRKRQNMPPSFSRMRPLLASEMPWSGLATPKRKSSIQRPLPIKTRISPIHKRQLRDHMQMRQPRINMTSNYFRCHHSKWINILLWTILPFLFDHGWYLSLHVFSSCCCLGYLTLDSHSVPLSIDRISQLCVRYA